MSLGLIVLLALLIFAAAALYSSVGHAGASGYLAAMALCGVSASVMKPTALILNVLVATIATAKFARAGCFSMPLFWPFAVASVPFAALGGFLTLPGWLYLPVLGVVLFYAAFRLLKTAKTPSVAPGSSPPLPPALASGAGIGLLSGLTGVGGGIFLSPLLLFMGWAETRQSSGVSAAFILVNEAIAKATWNNRQLYSRRLRCDESQYKERGRMAGSAETEYGGAFVHVEQSTATDRRRIRPITS